MLRTSTSVGSRGGREGRSGYSRNGFQPSGVRADDGGGAASAGGKKKDEIDVKHLIDLKPTYLNV